MIRIKYETWKKTCELIKEYSTKYGKFYLQLYPIKFCNNYEVIITEKYFKSNILNGKFLMEDNNYTVCENYEMKDDGTFRNKTLIPPILYIYYTAIVMEISNKYVEKRNSNISVRYAGNYKKGRLHYRQEYYEFINELDEAGLLENTIIVLYGDHDARLPRADYNKLYNYNMETHEFLTEEDPNYKEYDSFQYEVGRRVPFIIWSKDMAGTDLNKEITNVMGMYDIMPTLGNMLGFHNKYVLGHDIFNINENNIVVFPNGNWVTNKMYYNSQKAAYLPLSDDPISEEEISNNSEYANKLLDVSNDIIVFDLLNEDKNKDSSTKK